MKRLLMIAILAAFAVAGVKAQNEVKEYYWVAEYGDELQQAPEFSFKNLDGKEVSLSDYRGKWVLLDFWGSWCKYCIASFPAMKNLYENTDRNYFEILGIDCRDTEEAWRTAVERYEIPWPTLYNPQPKGGETVTAYGIVGYPSYVLVDPMGDIFGFSLGENEDFFQLVENEVWPITEIIIIDPNEVEEPE